MVEFPIFKAVETNGNATALVATEHRKGRERGNTGGTRSMCMGNRTRDCGSVCLGFGEIGRVKTGSDLTKGVVF